MENIEKIIFTGQVLRKDFSAVIDWFYQLIGIYPKMLTDLPIEVLVSNEYEYYDSNPSYTKFDIGKFYSFYGISNINQLSDFERNKIWAEIFYNKTYNKEAYEYVYGIFKNSLAIVHETEIVIMNILDYYDIPYIDMNTDPIRFLDDQLFCFRTNNKNIFNKLIKYKLNENIPFLYANYIKTANTSYKLSFENGNNVLFLGQTTCDKSLIDKDTNQLYSILDHQNDFENAVKDYDKIYYKPHPMSDNTDGLSMYLSKFKNLEITNENFYQLLCRDDIKKVVAISSGGCIEAKYFNKASQTLLRDSIKISFEDNFDKESYLPVSDKSMETDFWADVLSAIIDVKDLGSNVKFSNNYNKIRNSRGANGYWGYEDLNQKMVLHNIDKVTQQFTECKNDSDFWKKVKKTISSVVKNSF